MQRRKRTCDVRVTRPTKSPASHDALNAKIPIHYKRLSHSASTSPRWDARDIRRAALGTRSRPGRRRRQRRPRRRAGEARSSVASPLATRRRLAGEWSMNPLHHIEPKALQRRALPSNHRLCLGANLSRAAFRREGARSFRAPVPRSDYSKRPLSLSRKLARCGRVSVPISDASASIRRRCSRVIFSGTSTMTVTSWSPLPAPP